MTTRKKVHLIGNPTHVRQKIASITQRLSLPSICVLCKQYHRESVAVCKRCMVLFHRIEPACQYCAYPLTDQNFLCCGVCVKQRPSFDRTYIAYRYEEPLRSLIHQFKYQEKLVLGSFLTRLILDAIDKDTLPQCLIPIPLHRKRLRQRGFNQAALLTQTLSKQLKIPYRLNQCEKTINTRTQASLDLKHRKSNLKNAFHVSKLPFKHIALVDDLLTTGSTANELARCFKMEGVERVDIWCCARAVMD